MGSIPQGGGQGWRLADWWARYETAATRKIVGPLHHANLPGLTTAELIALRSVGPYGWAVYAVSVLATSQQRRDRREAGEIPIADVALLLDVGEAEVADTLTALAAAGFRALIGPEYAASQVPPTPPTIRQGPPRSAAVPHDLPRPATVRHDPPRSADGSRHSPADGRTDGRTDLHPPSPTESGPPSPPDGQDAGPTSLLVSGLPPGSVPDLVQARATPEDFAAIWNAEVSSPYPDDGPILDTVRAMNGQRRRRVLECLREEPDLERWRWAIRALLESGFHVGRNDRGWRADLDFLVQPAQRSKWLDAGEAEWRRREDDARLMSGASDGAESGDV